MGARLEQRDADRLGLDADGRRVFVGSATIGLEGESDASARVWCLGADDELLWWVADDDTPSGRTLVWSPSRTELLVGSPDRFIRIEAASGSIVEHDLKTDLRSFAWARDSTLVGIDGGRLLRRTLNGEPAPTWAQRDGLSGGLDRLVEPWLSRSESVAAMMLGGRASRLLFAPDRAIRVGNSAATIAGPDGELHLVQEGTVSFGKGDDRPAVTWLRFDERGMVLHRIVVPTDGPTDDAVLDARGCLWVRISPGARNAIVRIDPAADTARVVVSSKRLDRIEGFTVDAQGELRLPTQRKVDTPEGAEASVPVVRRRSRFKPLATVATLVLAGLNAAVVPKVLAVREFLLHQASSGEPLRMKAGKSGHKMLQVADLEALAPGQLAYAAELIVLSVGLVLLTIAARTTPVRAVSLAWAWATLVAVLAVVINSAVTLRPMGGFDTFTLAGIPAGVQLGTWMALLFLSAFGQKFVK